MEYKSIPLYSFEELDNSAKEQVIQKFSKTAISLSDIKTDPFLQKCENLTKVGFKGFYTKNPDIQLVKGLQGIIGFQWDGSLLEPSSKIFENWESDLLICQNIYQEDSASRISLYYNDITISAEIKLHPDLSDHPERTSSTIRVNKSTEILPNYEDRYLYNLHEHHYKRVLEILLKIREHYINLFPEVLDPDFTKQKFKEWDEYLENYYKINRLYFKDGTLFTNNLL